MSEQIVISIGEKQKILDAVENSAKIAEKAVEFGKQKQAEINELRQEFEAYKKSHSAKTSFVSEVESKVPSFSEVEVQPVKSPENWGNVPKQKSKREYVSPQERQVAFQKIMAWLPKVQPVGYYDATSVNIYDRKSHAGNVKFSLETAQYGKRVKRAINLKTGEVYKSKGN